MSTDRSRNNPLSAHPADVLSREDSEEVVRAISKGQVDAFVVSPGDHPEVITLATADLAYRVLVDRMSEGAVTIAEDHTILFANPPFALLVGAELEGLPGSPLSSFVEEADRPLLEALVAQRAETRVDAEITFKRGSAQFPARVKINRSFDGGRSTCLIISDLTEQKHYEAVIAAEALGRSILDQALDVVVVCDARGDVMRASRSAASLCGCNPLLQPFARIFPLQRAGEPQHTGGALDLDRVLAGEALKNVAFELNAPGRRASLLVSAGPIVDASGSTVACVVTMSDITELKRTEAELRDADARKDEMLALVIHELRNPLAAISLAQLFLKRHATDQPEIRRSRDILERQVKHLSRLVEDLSDFTRIRLGKLDIKRSRLDLRTLVEQVAETQRPLMEARQLSFHVSLPQAPVEIDADAERLSQVFVNLLNNAHKFTPDGGHIQLSLTVDAESKHAAVTVRDDGAGIGEALLPKIFDAFTQGPFSRQQGGLGIGLTLVRRIVELHDGRIDASSAGPNTGSAFTVRLPLAV